jgi:hypothetical protein
MKKPLLITIAIVLITGYLLRIFPLKKDNLYFTVDQGRDAVYVRDILTRYKVITKGPETSIRGIFTGPLWYYFLSPGYALFNGHPFGGILVLIMLNLATTAFLIWWLNKKTNLKIAFLTGITLQLFWPFYETSLWAFNPFPVASLAIIQTILLTEFLAKNKKYYFYALIPILLALNSHLAAAMVLLIAFITVGIWGVRQKIIPFKQYLITSLAIPSVAVIIILRQLIKTFIHTQALNLQPTGQGTFSGTSISQMSTEFVKIIGSATIPQSTILGFLLFVLVLYLFIQNRKTNPTIRNFVYLTLLLTSISFIFFASNKGWRSWHTAYLPPLLFISTILMLTQIPKKIAASFLILVVLLQIINFQKRFFNYISPSDNPSVLYNQLKAIDWIYQNSEEQGFSAYNYTDTFYDFPYQYLFWWYGLEKYDYLPCEYSNFPLSAKELYVPGYDHYLEPRRGCDRLKFLIIQSDTNGEDNEKWIEKFRNYNNLVDSTSVGDILIEKYYVKPGSPNDFCLWWGRCD